MNLDLLKLINHKVRIDAPVKYDFDEIMKAVLYLGNTLMPEKKDADGKRIDFTLEGERKEMYSQLIYYFFNDARFKGNLSAGLWIHGGKGTGKTMALNIFRHLSFSRLISTKKGFNLAYCDAIVTEYQDKGAPVLNKYHANNYAFDDIGSENKQANYFGTTRNIMSDILATRYRNFIDFGHLTYLTSNFNRELIAQEYDLRIEDRFNEMFNEITLTGTSLRK